VSARLSARGLALLAAIAAGAVWLALRTAGGGAFADDAAEARDATMIGGAPAGIVALHARTLDGVEFPLGRTTVPVVVMVSSETCQYCQAAMHEMGRVAAGRPLGALRLVTLEGAAAGEPMVRAAGIGGATLAGPPTPAEEALFTFQIPGTPTFVALDARGHVTRTLVGYPGDAKFRPWIDVMLGDRAAP